MIERKEIMDGIYRHIQSLSGVENIKILEIEPGHSKLSVEVTQGALNLYGNAHGGFLFTICDIAAGMSTYAYEIENVTQGSSIDYIRPAHIGTLIIESKAVHKGRNTVINSVTISQDDKLVSTALFTMFLGNPV